MYKIFPCFVDYFGGLISVDFDKLDIEDEDSVGRDHISGTTATIPRYRLIDRWIEG